MVSKVLIRPFLPDELQAYFKLRFDAARRYNSALISEHATEDSIEVDNFDQQAIHIGCFDQDNNLMGCIRLASPRQKDIFPAEFLAYQQGGRSKKTGNERKGHTLPSSVFLNGKELQKLEKYFRDLIDSGKTISESGRFINWDDTFNPRLVRAMLCYVWAMNLYFGVDYCFFNTTSSHGRYYKRLFNCVEIFPEISFNTGAKELKYLLYADIQHPPSSQDDMIKEIHKSFVKSKGLDEYVLNLELVG